MAAKTWCGHVPASTCPQARLQYQIEISQKKNSDGEAVYKIIINGEIFHEVINTTPRNFYNATLYLSDVHYDTFGPYGSLANLRISSALSKLIKSYMY